MPPAIDPLSPKNIDLGVDVVSQVLDWIGVELDRPLVTQVSRFDPWKDPLGVVAAYRLVREEVPRLRSRSPGRWRSTIRRAGRCTGSSSRSARTIRSCTPSRT
jgi:hypothetical protein